MNKFLRFFIIIFWISSTKSILNTEILTMNEHNIRNLIEQPKPVIIRAYGDWNGTCKLHKDDYQKVADKLGDKYLFTQFNVDAEERLSEYFDIKDIPTYIYIKDSTVISTEYGAANEENLLYALRRNFGECPFNSI